MADVESLVKNMQDEVACLEQKIHLMQQELHVKRNALRKVLGDKVLWVGSVGQNKPMFAASFDEIYDEICMRLKLTGIEYRSVQESGETQITFYGQVGYVDEVPVAWMRAQINDGLES